MRKRKLQRSSNVQEMEYVRRILVMKFISVLGWRSRVVRLFCDSSNYNPVFKLCWISSKYIFSFTMHDSFAQNVNYLAKKCHIRMRHLCTHGIFSKNNKPRVISL